MDLALITSAEALATQAAAQAPGRALRGVVPAGRARRRSRGSRRPTRSRSRTRCSRRGSRSRCSTTRAARHLGVGLDDYRARDRRDARADDARSRRAIRTPGTASRDRPTRSSTPAPDNRMVGYPYTKYMVSVMDVDMAGALVVATHERADALGVPADRRVYLRGWCYARDPVLVAEHPDLVALAGDGGRERGGAAARRHRRSTTSRTSTSTRASRARCTSRATRSASRRRRSARPHRHRRPAVSRRSRRAGTSRTRSRRWSSGCAPSPTRPGW